MFDSRLTYILHLLSSIIFTISYQHVPRDFQKISAWNFSWQYQYIKETGDKNIENRQLVIN